MLYTKCGLKDDGILFLMTESHITNERFLVYMNDLLSSGEIAELYTEDDKMNIVNIVRPKVKADGKSDTPDECWAWYIEKVVCNLHVCLCFSPGEDFRRRAKRFPALVTCTVINWFHAWPQDALLNVAKNKLEEIELGTDEIRDAVTAFMPYSFAAVNQAGKKCFDQEKRYVYTTPKSFLELIMLFSNMLNKRKATLDAQKEMYETGLIKLEETEMVVGKLEEDLKVIAVEVDAKKAEADKVAAIVGAEKAKVQVESDKAKVVEDETNVVKRDATALQLDCEEAVGKLEPLVEEAKAKVNNLDIKDLSNLKALQNPPPGIDKVFFCIMIMFSGVPGYDYDIDLTGNKLPKNLDWKSGCLKVMKDPRKLMDRMLEFPKEINDNKVPKQNFSKISAYFETEPAFKDVKLMENKSKSAAGILQFLMCMVQYYDAMTMMIPKRIQLAEANERLSLATIKLAKVQAEVVELDKALAILVAEFDKANAEKQAAIDEADRCNRKLDLAQRLVSALGSEKIRWADSIVRLGEQLDVVVGDILISAAFVSYAGPFSKTLRMGIMDEDFLPFIKKKKIPMTPDLVPIDILADDADRASWNNDGLPSDIVSIENGAIFVTSERFPLMVDPQLQGTAWIKEKYKPLGLITMRVGAKNYVNIAERCLDDGTPIMFENLEDSIDPIIMPIVARNTFKRAGKKYMKFGGKDILLNEKFRLILQTKLSNPHYPPEVQAEAALINFTVTEAGLSDQLLDLIVSKERPDLSSKRIQLISQQNKFKIKLKELEADLLFRLNSSKGDILDDVELIENLEYSKKLSTEIAIKVEIAEKTQIIIATSSEHYRPCADRGA